MTKSERIFQLAQEGADAYRMFKALLAKDAGQDVRHLILIGDPGSGLLSQAPTPVSVIKWVEQRHQIRVQIWELKDKDRP